MITLSCKDNDSINQIKQQYGIIDAIKEAGASVSQKGHRYFANCLFHTENTPSMELYPGQGKGYCHGCKKNFDAIDVYAIVNNISNAEAIKRLQERFGVTHNVPDKKELVAAYDYRGADGSLVYQVQRFSHNNGKKSFVQRRPDGKGGWFYDLKGVKPIPYRLPELLSAIEQGNMICIAEGEKCCNALTEAGLVATCNSGGAGKWGEKHSLYFPGGTKVSVFPDNDNVGHNHAKEVSSSLLERGCEVKIIELPGLPQKGDIADWFTLGGTKDNLLDIIANTANLSSAERAKVTARNGIFTPGDNNRQTFNLTELGMAERVIYENNGTIRYCAESKQFYLWTGKRWQQDTDGEIRRLAAKTIRGLYDTRGAEDKVAQAKFAKSCETRSRIDNICALVKTLPGVPLSITQMDGNKYLLNCLSGTIDLRTQQLLPHNKAHNITHLLPFKYEPYQAETDCQRWVKFLLEITNNNLDIVRYLWKLAGLCLSGDTSEHVLNIFYGQQGRNGKGVFLGVLQKILGDLAAVLPFHSLEPKRAGTIPNDIARLCGKRLVVAQESGEGKKLDEPVVKSLTGGDMQTGRYLGCEFFDFWPTHKIIVASNNRPVVSETSDSIWTRLRLIPFEVSFIGREDKKLAEKLEAELPQIFSWCVAGFAVWQKEGLTMPEAVKQASAEYRISEDVIQSFITEHCYLSEHATAGAKDLFETFISWCERNGEKPIKRKVFNDRLKSRGFSNYLSNGTNKYKGIGIINSRLSATS